jgi:predicted enzyme related to lactoylglutathione lyase
MTTGTACWSTASGGSAFSSRRTMCPPDWPDGTQQQIHLDLYLDDLKAAHEKATSLGARLLKPAKDVEAPEGYQVYADPAGHPFCLCWD